MTDAPSRNDRIPEARDPEAACLVTHISNSHASTDSLRLNLLVAVYYVFSRRVLRRPPGWEHLP